jgi:hypothetical protein
MTVAIVLAMQTPDLNKLNSPNDSRKEGLLASTDYD